MGSQVVAICKCGVHNTILVGGGKFNYRFTEYFPCLCVDCEDVVESNLKMNIYKQIDISLLLDKEKHKGPIELPLKDRKITCPECKGQNVIPYNDERLIGRKGDNIVINWGNHSLTNGTYYCPKCKEMRLNFTGPLMFWD